MALERGGPESAVDPRCSTFDQCLKKKKKRSQTIRKSANARERGTVISGKMVGGRKIL